MQDLKLKLDPAFMPPEQPRSAGPAVPPLRLGPTEGGFDPLAPIPPSVLLPPPGAAAPDLFANYAEPAGEGETAMNALKGMVHGLGNGPGVQVDKNGIGATVDDWKLRFMPYIPFLNEP